MKNSTMQLDEVSKLSICRSCGAFFQKLYQNKSCKRCLLKSFEKCRKFQDKYIGNRYNTLADSDTTIPASLPTSREFFTDTLELVEPKEIITPWLTFHRTKYFSSTYPRKFW